MYTINYFTLRYSSNHIVIYQGQITQNKIQHN